MNILLINSQLYTSEISKIQRVDSIKDTMIYTFAVGMQKMGHSVTLIASDDYKPIKKEFYEIKIIYLRSVLKNIFIPRLFPFHPMLPVYLKNNRNEYDIVISSEVFSLNSFCAAIICPRKTIIWQELAEHNRMFKKIPSRLWYNIVTRCFMRRVYVVPRSERAIKFISQYHPHVSKDYIEHGLDLKKFRLCKNKKNKVIVVSQLIKRKQIDSIIQKYYKYLQKYNDNDTTLIIAGDGECKEELRNLVLKLEISKRVRFMGFLPHKTLLPLLSESLALFIDTTKDLNMVTIAESVACGTPVLTNTVPYSSSYIKSNKLGVVRTKWNEDDIHEIITNSLFYTNNCIKYREKLSNTYLATKMIKIAAGRNK